MLCAACGLVAEINGRHAAVSVGGLGDGEALDVRLGGGEGSIHGRAVGQGDVDGRGRRRDLTEAPRSGRVSLLDRAQILSHRAGWRVLVGEKVVGHEGSNKGHGDRARRDLVAAPMPERRLPGRQPWAYGRRRCRFVIRRLFGLDLGAHLISPR